MATGSSFEAQSEPHASATVAIRTHHRLWPDRERAAYVERFAQPNAALFERIYAECRERAVYRVRAQTAARDESVREFLEAVGLRFRGVVKGAALFEAVLPIEDTRAPFATTPLAQPYAARELPATVLLDGIRSAYNIGAFFRTADAAGIRRVYLRGTAAWARPRIAKTALGAEDRVPHEMCGGADETIARIREEAVEIAAIETSAGAVDLFEWQPRTPVCVAFGGEVDGISPEILRQCDTRVRIPMLGLKHSLNVSVAGGVVLFELLRKMRGNPKAQRETADLRNRVGNATEKGATT